MSNRSVATIVAVVLLVPIALPLVPLAAAQAPETPSSSNLPTFGVFPGPTGSNPSNSEPTIGINHATGAVFFQQNARTWKINFDLEANPVTAVWSVVTPPNSITNVDPMLFTDLGTGRTYAGGLDGECSIMSFTDDDGVSWTPTGNQCAGAFDHQTIGSGPWAEPVPDLASHDRAVYYCAQGWVNFPENACVTSYDGGIVYGPPVMWSGPCFGLHGHVNISPNGFAYVPTRNCNGSPGYAYSRDNGLSWQSKNFPAFASAGSGFDSTIASSVNNRLWFGFERSDWVPMVATSNDNGDTWTTPVAVGQDLGIKTSTFLRVMSGDADRAALVFLGSTTGGNPFAQSWNGIWHLYVSYTYDGGATWQTVQVTQDPVQRGWMCAGGTLCQSGRNLLDFMGSTLGPRGEVLVGFADGCIGSCAGQFGTPSQSTSAYSTVARQLTGRTLFAAHDAAAVDITGTLLGTVGTPLTLQANVRASAPYTAIVNWGDGVVDTFPGQTSPAFSASHSYASAGQYNVGILVRGADGAEASDSAQASVSNPTGGAIQITSHDDGDAVGDLVTLSGVVTSSGNTAPTASFTFAATGLEVQFDATASSDAENDPLVFSWTFGDGGTGAGVAPAHTYSSSGTYDACLSVSDGSLATQVCASVTVSGGGAQTVVTDDAGDSENPWTGGEIPDMDVLAVEAEKSTEGNIVLTIVVATLGTPDHHATQGADGAQWLVQWQGPQRVDYMSLDAGLASYSCHWGFIDPQTEFYSQEGNAPCSVTPGTPGRVTITFPAMADGGYTGTELLTGITATTSLWTGTPTDFPGVGGIMWTVDTTEAPGEWSLGSMTYPYATHGIGPTHASKPAPSQPPEDPHIRDQVANPIGDNVPTTNIESAWFDADATNLYVGLKIQDIPADPTSTAFISYSVNFKPAYPVADPTWGGAVSGQRVFLTLTAFALYSPARLNGLTPASDTATTFELQVYVNDPVARQNFFTTRAQLSGSIDPNTDIVWWIIPRTLLQDPAGGAIMEKTNAVSVPAIGGVVTFGSFSGDATGDGEDYAFPATPPTPPTVTLTATPTSGTVPLSVLFTPGVTPAGVTTWTMDYDDGTVESGSGSFPASFSHVYESTGDHTARFSVTAPGGSGAADATITVGQSTGTTLSVIVEALGGAPVAANCADGCATWTADLDLSAVAPGDVTLSATLLRNGEAVSVDSVVVTLSRIGSVVIDAPLDGSIVNAGNVAVTGRLAGQTNAPPVATLSADRGEGTAPLDVVFTLGGSDDVGIASWRLTTGDGRVVDDGGIVLPTTVAHTYNAVGDHLVTFTVRDTGGRSATVNAIVRVQAQNAPPTEPSSPSPADGAIDLAIPLTLSWTASDPDGNTLAYDVYLDDVDGNTLVAIDQTASYMPTLASGKTYFWRVVAKDGTTSTAGPTWSFSTAPPFIAEIATPHVVVALIDSGINPYHEQFRRAHLVDHPSTYLTDFPATAIELDLCFYDAATRTVDQSRCPTSPNTAATGGDLAQWQKFSITPGTQTGAGQGKIAWFPGTNVLLVSFNHAGDARFPGLDGSLGAADNHGTYTASNVGGSTTGSCPECIIVMIEGDDVAGIENAYRWAANQPWIDVITSSVSIGQRDTGWNPGDFYDATSAATKTAVQNGKIVFEAAGNGAQNFGLVPTSTYLHANAAPWSIPVGCSAEHTGQACGYHDFPNPVTASGVERVGASANSFTSTKAVGGTSFSSPSTAGVTARALLAARVAMNDTAEGPDATTKSLLRVGGGKTAPASGPFANGILTKLELEEAVFKTARRSALPQVPTYLDPTGEIVSTPVGFVKEGFGNVYRGDWGVGHTTALSTWSSAGDITSVLLGQKDMPRRWIEEFWWERIVTPVQVQIFSADVPEPDADGWPRNDPADPTSVTGYNGPSARAPTPKLQPRGISAVVPLGSVPTPEANRLYLHHNNLGLDPNSANGNSLYERYINNVADPAGGASTCTGESCPDQNGVGATGVNPDGYSVVYAFDHPRLGGPILLDTAEDVVIRIVARGYQGAPPTPASVAVTLTSGATVVGSVQAERQIDGSVYFYEARFKPRVDAIADPTELHVSWAGPTYSMHIQTRGSSWIDLPIIAALPPITYEPVTYYLDDFDASYANNGDTVILTTDVADLAGDADAGFTWLDPQPQGAVINLAAAEALATSSSLLGTSASARVYPCTFPYRDLGAAEVTFKVTLSVGGNSVGAGSLTTTVAGLHTAHDVGVVVPIAVQPVLVPMNKPLEGSIVISGPNGVFTPNMAICGGGEAHPISITLSMADLDAVPTTTLDPVPATLTGDVAISGIADFPTIPVVGTETWYAIDMDAWESNGQTMTLDTSGPGEGAGGPIFLPLANGLTLNFRSARPVASDATRLADDGIGGAQFWVTAVPASPTVTVDIAVYLEGAGGAQRLLGSGSQTKHVIGENILVDERFAIEFVPAVVDPQPDEHLVMVVKVRNVGPAMTSQVSSMGGGSDMPIFVQLPIDADTVPVAPHVRVALGGNFVDVPTSGGTWTAIVDSREVANGDHTLSVTPRATYAGVQRTGAPVTAEVTVQNGGLNTPPTATLSLAPTSGFAPLLVTASVGGSDAQTPLASLAWSLDWGDGSPAATGTGLPAAPTHTYATGNFVATLTVTDSGGKVATANAAVSAIEPEPVEKIVLIVDGAAPIDATDDSGDGSFREWSATLNLVDAGLRTITARHVRGTETLSEQSVSVTVRIPQIPTVIVTAPADGARVAPGAAITGTVEYASTVDAVQLSTDPTFASFVSATSPDGFATWSAPVNALGLAEDVATAVHVRALAADADEDGTSRVTVTLDGAPNARIDVTGTPAFTGTAIGFWAQVQQAATGAEITGHSWNFGDGNVATGVSANHAFARSGTYDVTLTVTDANGQTGSATTSVLVINRAPEVTLGVTPEQPTDLDTVSISAGATDADGSIASIGITVYNGADRDSGVLATGGDALSLQFPDDGDYLIVARAVDDEGAATELDAILTVLNVRPVADLIASATEIGVGQEVTLDASGSSDPDGSIVEYRFDLGDGTPIVSQPTPMLDHSYDEPGIYQVRVTVVDDDGAEITSAAIAIKANGAPVLATIGNRVVLEGELLEFTISATDGEGDPITYSAAPLPAGATFDANTATFSWTPAFGQDGNYEIRFAASDGRLSDHEDVIVSVGDVDLPPTMTPIGPRIGAENQLLTFAIEASDPDTPQLTYTADGLPTGANLQSATGIFTWTPDFNQAGKHFVTFRVSDATTTRTELVEFTIANTDRLPVIAPIAPGNVVQTHLLTLPVSATDADAELITFSVVGPEGVTVHDFGNGQAQLRWTPTIAQLGAFQATVTAHAGEGSASTSTLITVKFKADLTLIPAMLTVVQASPATAVTLKATIKNVGPQPDTYRFSVSNDRGWQFGELPAPITLAPGESALVSLDVITDGAKPTSWTSITATSEGDGTTSKLVRFRVDIPVVLQLDLDEIEGVTIPRGTVNATHLDGTPAAGAIITVIQTPALLGYSFRSSQTGTADANGKFAFDFTRDYRGMAPGQHELLIVGKKNGGFETVLQTEYIIGA